MHQSSSEAPGKSPDFQCENQYWDKGLRYYRSGSMTGCSFICTRAYLLCYHSTYIRNSTYIWNSKKLCFLLKFQNFFFNFSSNSNMLMTILLLCFGFFGFEIRKLQKYKAMCGWLFWKIPDLLDIKVSRFIQWFVELKSIPLLFQPMPITAYEKEYFHQMLFYCASKLILNVFSWNLLLLLHCLPKRCLIGIIYYL